MSAEEWNIFLKQKIVETLTTEPRAIGFNDWRTVVFNGQEVLDIH
jgi:hypothetical protein